MYHTNERLSIRRSISTHPPDVLTVAQTTETDPYPRPAGTQRRLLRGLEATTTPSAGRGSPHAKQRC
jgi:hypothetical protein